MLGQTNTFLQQSIQMRRLRCAVIEAGKIAVAHVIGENKKNVGRLHINDAFT